MFYKVKKIVSLCLSVVLFISIVSGFFWVQEHNGCSYKNMFQNNSYPFVSELNVNRKINPDNHASQNDNRGEKKNLIETLFTISGAFVFTGIASIVALIGLVSKLFCGYVFTKDNEVIGSRWRISRLMYYKGWCVYFYSPVEQCMNNRVDEYDINPIRRYIRYKNPRLALLRQSAGFFMDK